MVEQTVLKRGCLCPNCGGYNADLVSSVGVDNNVVDCDDCNWQFEVNFKLLSTVVEYSFREFIPFFRMLNDKLSNNGCFSGIELLKQVIKKTSLDSEYRLSFEHWIRHGSTIAIMDICLGFRSNFDSDCSFHNAVYGIDLAKHHTTLTLDVASEYFVFKSRY